MFFCHSVSQCGHELEQNKQQTINTFEKSSLEALKKSDNTRKVLSYTSSLGMLVITSEFVGAESHHRRLLHVWTVPQILGIFPLGVQLELADLLPC